MDFYGHGMNTTILRFPALKIQHHRANSLDCYFVIVCCGENKFLMSTCSTLQVFASVYIFSGRVVTCYSVRAIAVRIGKGAVFVHIIIIVANVSIILVLPLLVFLCILYPKNNDLLEYPLKLRFSPQ